VNKKSHIASSAGWISIIELADSCRDDAKLVYSHIRNVDVEVIFFSLFTRTASLVWSLVCSLRVLYILGLTPIDSKCFFAMDTSLKVTAKTERRIMCTRGQTFLTRWIK
jgi:hypothetical protein